MSWTRNNIQNRSPLNHNLWPWQPQIVLVSAAGFKGRRLEREAHLLPIPIRVRLPHKFRARRPLYSGVASKMHLDGQQNTSWVIPTLRKAASSNGVNRYWRFSVQSMDDQCPVCKSDRYLNPKLRLLVSSCYHKMYAASFRKKKNS